MHIIFISKYQGKVERGVENYVSELSLRLANKHQVLVITSIKDLIGKKPDIIYPLNGGFQSLFCRIYSWIIGAKLILGGHAGIGRDDRWNLYLFSSLFIAFSQKGYGWAKKVNPFIKIAKIPYGIDLEKFNPRVKPAKLDLEKPRFICVSHLDPYKRVDLAIKAVSKLKKGSLLILGKGSESKKIDDLGNKLLNGLSSRAKSGDLTSDEIATSQTPRNDGTRKRYLRLLAPHDQVVSYLTASDVFTLVSESSEAFGLVYIEALACNLPVVGTDDSLRRELIGNAGEYVSRPENVDEYANALQKTLELNWKNKPRQQAEKFSWDKIVSQYEKYFSHHSGL